MPILSTLSRRSLLACGIIIASQSLMAAPSNLKIEDHLTLLRSYTEYHAKAKKCKLGPEAKMTKERYDSKLANLKRITKDLEIEIAMELLQERTEKEFEPSTFECQKVKAFINTYMSSRD